MNSTAVMIQLFISHNINIKIKYFLYHIIYHITLKKKFTAKIVSSTVNNIH